MMVGEIVARMRLDLTDFQTGLGKAQSLLQQHAQHVGQVIMLLTAIGGAAAAGMGLASREAAQMQTALTDMLKVLQLTEAELEATAEQLHSLARATGVADEALAGSLANIARAGVSGAEGMKVLESATRAAVAGGADMATVADTQVSVMRAYGLSVEQAAASMDTLLRASQVGRMSFQDLMAALRGVVPVASQLGIGYNQLAAALATMTTVGYDAENSLMGLNMVMVKLSNPSAQLKAALSQAGYASGQALVEARGLAGAIQFLTDAAGDDEQAMIQMAGGARAFKAVAALAAQDGALFAQKLEQVSDSVGAVDRAFASSANTFAMQSRQMRTAISQALEAFGADLIPVLTFAGRILTALAVAIAAVPAPLRTTMVAAVGLTAAVTLGGAAWLAYGSHIRGGIALLGKLVVALAGSRAAVIANAIATARGSVSPMIGLRGMAPGASSMFALGQIVKPGDFSLLTQTAAGVTVMTGATARLTMSFRIAAGAVRGFFASLGPIGWMMIAILGVVEVWRLWTNHVEKAKEEAEKQAEATRKQTEALAELLPKLKEVNDEIAKGQAAGKPPTKEQLEQKGAVESDIADVMSGWAKVDPNTGKRRLAFPLQTMAAQMTAEQRTAWASYILEQRAKVAEEIGRRGELQAELAKTAAQRKTYIEQAERIAARKGAPNLATSEADRAAQENKWRHAAAEAAVCEVELGKAIEKTNAAIREGQKDLKDREEQARTVAEKMRATEARRSADEAKKRADDQVAAAAARAARTELEKQAAQELKNLGVPREAADAFTRAIGEFVNDPKLGDLRKRSKEFQDAWEASGERMGGAYEKAIRAAVRTYLGEMQKVTEAGENETKAADARGTAELNLQTNLWKAQKDHEEERKQASQQAMERGKRERDERINGLERETSAWRDAADALKESGQMSLGAWLKQLVQMVQWLRRENQNFGAKPSTELLQRERELTKTIFEERTRLTEGIREREKQAHEERVRWTREEADHWTEMYQHRLAVIDLVLQGEADRRKVAGEEAGSIEANQAKERLEILRTMGPGGAGAGSWKPLYDVLVAQAEGAGAGPNWAQQEKLKDQARAMAEAGQGAMPAEARLDWAKQIREAGLAAYQGGQISRDEIEAILQDVMRISLDAQQEVHARQAEEFAARQREHDLTIGHIETEAKTWRDALATAGTGIVNLVNQMAEAWKQQLQRAMQGGNAGMVPATATAGTSGGGPTTVNLYYNGERIGDIAVPQGRKEDLARVVTEIITESLEHDQRFPRGG